MHVAGRWCGQDGKNLRGKGVVSGQLGQSSVCSGAIHKRRYWIL
jgi:hypothetical protein